MKSYNIATDLGSSIITRRCDKRCTYSIPLWYGYHSKALGVSTPLNDIIEEEDINGLHNKKKSIHIMCISFLSSKYCRLVFSCEGNWLFAEVDLTYRIGCYGSLASVYASWDWPDSQTLIPASAPERSPRVSWPPECPMTSSPPEVWTWFHLPWHPVKDKIRMRIVLEVMYFPNTLTFIIIINDALIIINIKRHLTHSHSIPNWPEPVPW